MNGMETIISNILTRLANHEDLDDLLSLNLKWQKSALENQLQNGFLSLAFDEKMLKNIIQSKEMIVAVDRQDNVVGYSCVNHYSDIIPKYSGKKVTKLKQERKIDPSLNVALGGQILLELGYRGDKNRILLFDALIQSIKSKYNLLFSSVAKENKAVLMINLQDGWEIVDEDDKHYYLVFDMRYKQLFTGFR